MNTSKNLYIKTLVEFGTPAYEELVHLRDEVLRKPLNLTFHPEDLALEYDSYHFGLYNQQLELLATLILKPINDTTVKMRQVAVSPSHQSKGLGKELVKFSEVYARKKGFTLMELHARHEAVPFYQTMDYDIEGDQFMEVNIPHFKMRKML